MISRTWLSQETPSSLAPSETSDEIAKPQSKPNHWTLKILTWQWIQTKRRRTFSFSNLPLIPLLGQPQMLCDLPPSQTLYNSILSVSSHWDQVLREMIIIIRIESEMALVSIVLHRALPWAWIWCRIERSLPACSTDMKTSGVPIQTRRTLTSTTLAPLLRTECLQLTQ